MLCSWACFREAAPLDFSAEYCESLSGAMSQQHSVRYLVVPVRNLLILPSTKTPIPLSTHECLLVYASVRASSLVAGSVLRDAFWVPSGNKKKYRRVATS